VSPLMAAAASSIRRAGSTTTAGRYTVGAAMPIICLCCNRGARARKPAVYWAYATLFMLHAAQLAADEGQLHCRVCGRGRP
jgi:hypothetical protein